MLSFCDNSISSIQHVQMDANGNLTFFQTLNVEHHICEQASAEKLRLITCVFRKQSKALLFQAYSTIFRIPSVIGPYFSLYLVWIYDSPKTSKSTRPVWTTYKIRSVDAAEASAGRKTRLGVDKHQLVQWISVSARDGSASLTITVSAKGSLDVV